MDKAGLSLLINQFLYSYMPALVKAEHYKIPIIAPAINI